MIEFEDKIIGMGRIMDPLLIVSKRGKNENCNDVNSKYVKINK